MSLEGFQARKKKCNSGERRKCDKAVRGVSFDVDPTPEFTLCPDTAWIEDEFRRMKRL